MKKIIAIFLSSFLYFSSSFALTTQDIPDEFQIKEHWISLTTAFDIESKTQKMGTLYRKFFALLLTYEFFDPYDNKMATAKARFFSLTAHFDIYDTESNFLGMAEERFLAFFPTFDVYGRDSITKVAKASMNFWGTTFYIYDPATDQEMATMYRPFFRIKNDWTINITNRELFNASNIDPKVLLTVLAFQGDREMWEKQDRDNKLMAKSDVGTAKSAAQVSSLLDKVEALKNQQGLTTVQKPDDQTLEAMAQKLEQDYQNATNKNVEALSNQDRVADFTNYCFNLVKSDTISAEDKKAILYLLKMRFSSTPFEQQ